MGRTTISLVGVLATAALAGCSGSADAPAPDPTPAPSSSAPKPSSTPTPTAPVMPAAAKAHTKAGATAFVEYFWEVVDYAQATGDTETIGDLIVPESCERCVRGIASIDNVYRKGGTVVGGVSTLDRFQTTVYALKGRDQATVEYHITISAVRFNYPGTTRDEAASATSARNRIRLAARPSDAWRVVLMEPVP